jgi:hypothetical protein
MAAGGRVRRSRGLGRDRSVAWEPLASESRGMNPDGRPPILPPLAGSNARVYLSPGPPRGKPLDSVLREGTQGPTTSTDAAPRPRARYVSGRRAGGTPLIRRRRVGLLDRPARGPSAPHARARVVISSVPQGLVAGPLGVGTPVPYGREGLLDTSPRSRARRARRATRLPVVWRARREDIDALGVALRRKVGLRMRQALYGSASEEPATASGLEKGPTSRAAFLKRVGELTGAALATDAPFTSHLEQSAGRTRPRLCRRCS